MRKIILLAALILVVAAGAAYTAAWYGQASQLKQAIEQNLANVNQQQKYITYDAIEISGFPQNVYVSIVKPHFSGRVDSIVKAMVVKSRPLDPDAAASVPEWTEDLLLDGNITIGVNALSDHYSLRVSGNWQRGSSIGSQKLSIASQSSGDSVCTLQMARTDGLFSNLWNYHALLRDNSKDFFKDFRTFDCNGAANIVSDANSHQTLISNAPWRIYITSTPQGAQQQMRFYTKFADIEVTPQGDAMMAMQRSALSPNAYPIKYSAFGKQNIEMDFTYTGPTDLQAANGNQPFDIELSKFDINNQLYTSSALFSLSNAMQASNRTCHLNLKFESNFAEGYDAFLRDLAHNFVQQLYDTKGRQFPPVAPYLQKYSPEEFYSIISPAIPNLHVLGKMVQALNVDYQGDANFAAGDFTLSSIELSAAPYGIKGNGTLKRLTGQMMPEGHAVLTCSNCDRLVDDIADYTTRFQKMMRSFQTPEQAAADTPINPKLVDGIKALLKAIAEPSQNNDYVYNITSNATGLTISGKALNDIMGLYNQYIVSVLKENAANAPLPPAATPAPAVPGMPVITPTPTPAPAITPAPTPNPSLVPTPTPSPSPVSVPTPAGR